MNWIVQPTSGNAGVSCPITFLLRRVVFAKRVECVEEVCGTSVGQSFENRNVCHSLCCKANEASSASRSLHQSGGMK